MDFQNNFITTFDFDDTERGTLVFSDPTKFTIDHVTQRITLRPDISTGLYPLGTSLFITSRLVSAQAFRSCVGFEGSYLNKIRPRDKAVPTSVLFRLWDGSNPWWWNGSAWAIATDNVNHWNADAVIANQIASYTQPRATSPAGALGVQVKLATTDATFTPELRWAKLAWSGKVHSFMEDILYRSLGPAIRANVQPIAEAQFAMPTTGTTFLLAAAAAAMGENFKIIGIDAAFLPADPGLMTNVVVSYNAGTDTVTLNQSVAAGTLLRLNLVYQPNVTIDMTHQDYTEVQKVPAITVNNVQTKDGSRAAWNDAAVNKSNFTATIIPPPYRQTIECDINVLCPTGIDLSRCWEKLLEWIEVQNFLVSKALGERYRLMIGAEYYNTSRPTSEGIYSARLRLDIVDVLFFKRPSSNGFGVGQFKLQGDFQTETITSSSGKPPLANNPES